MHPKTLRIWVRQDEADDGSRTNQLATVEREELTALRCEVRDLRRGGERRANLLDVPGLQAGLDGVLTH